MGDRAKMIHDTGRVFQLIRERRELWRLSPAIKRGRPRDYLEWETLRRWGKVPYWEETPAGYLLREARERAGFTQAELGERLGISQQAVSQAERSEANPTVSLMRRWAEACAVELEIRLADEDDSSSPSHG
ncbi:MAG: helix-turn-helix domain-containing protein [Gemmatimonadota bacterium]